MINGERSEILVKVINRESKNTNYIFKVLNYNIQFM